MTHEAFGELVDLSRQRVSQLVDEGTLQRGESGMVWLRAYVARLREQAAGRASGEPGGLDLVQERAALAREQRRSYEIKNAVAEGEYAPIELLASVLAAASGAVVDRMEQLPARLRKTCPDLSDEARQQIDAVLVAARNEWANATASLLDAAPSDEDDDDGLHDDDGLTHG